FLGQALLQEELAEATGLSLRTVQRVESGEQVSNSSWMTLARHFGVSVSSLRNNGSGNTRFLTTNRLASHRAGQLIIFMVTFFVCVGQWMAYND
ncbi:MAG: helix-turn-helix transcriptional regulator, partial [Gammaproteobacteria bacterium]